MSDYARWRLIETVPKDGTVVLLLYAPHTLSEYAQSVVPRKKIAIGCYREHQWKVGVPGGHSSGGDETQFTHWAHIPPFFSGKPYTGDSELE